MILAIFLLTILIHSTHVESHRNFNPNGLVPLLMDIALKRFPTCENIFVSDSHFRNTVSQLIQMISGPVYTVNLEDKPYFPSQKQGKREININIRGNSICSTIFICCKSIMSCKTEFSETLFKLLMDVNILKAERRAFLFMENETTSGLKPPALFLKDSLEEYPISIMNDVVELLKSIKSHITIIRCYVGTKFQERDLNSPIFELMTFTPNWVPGGSPLLHNIWSNKQGFWKSSGLNIRMQDLRHEGVVRFAVSNKELLPMINILHDQISGFEADILKLFWRKHEINPTFCQASDSDFGRKLKDGNWTGVIKDLLLKKADIGIGQIIFSEDRYSSGLKFSPAFDVLQGVIACPLPNLLPKWNILIAPFQRYMWIAVLLSTVIVLILGEALQHATRKLFHPKTLVGEMKVPKLWSSAWEPKSHESRNQWFDWIYFLGPLFQRSVPSDMGSKRMSFNCFFGIWLICGYLISSMFACILVGFLSFPPTEKPIDTLQQLLETNKPWSMTEIIEQTMDKTLSRVERILVDNYVQPEEDPNVHIDDDIEFEAASKTRTCLITEKLRGKYVIHTEYSKTIKGHVSQPMMRISKDSFFLGPTGWALRSDVDFIILYYMEHFFIYFRDHGFLLKAQDKFFDDIQTVVGPEESRVIKSLEMDSIQVVFYVYLIGLSFSCLVFILEIQYFKVKQGRNMKPRFQHQNRRIIKTQYIP